MSQRNRILSLLALAVLNACASEPKEETPPAVPPPVAATKVSDGSGVDYEGLKRELGLEKAAVDLGYSEATFNTCEVGYGYSSSKNCQRKYFAVVRFRLQCRDSIGTISTGLSAADLQAIAGREVRWSLGKTVGTDQTDGEGYAHAEGVFNASPRTERLRLAVGNQFLYMRAGEITRVVVPRPWCE